MAPTRRPAVVQGRRYRWARVSERWRDGIGRRPPASAAYSGAASAAPSRARHRATGSLSVRRRSPIRMLRSRWWAVVRRCRRSPSRRRPKNHAPGSGRPGRHTRSPCPKGDSRRRGCPGRLPRITIGIAAERGVGLVEKSVGRSRSMRLHERGSGGPAGEPGPGHDRLQDLQQPRLPGAGRRGADHQVGRCLGRSITWVCAAHSAIATACSSVTTT